ncbi:MAG: glycosyltransferase [Anaerolineae bacterium]|nr:glycosyltransferase [Anaerolineae bacterium]
MNILYLVPHVPNPTKARSHFQIRGLREAGHSITVATLVRSVRDMEHIQQLERAGCSVISARLTRQQAAWNSMRAVLRGLPLQARFMWSQDLWRGIEQALHDNPPDIIHVEHLRMAQYGLRLIDARPVVWDAVDELASLYAQAETASVSRVWQLVGRYEAPRLRSYEAWLMAQFPLTLVISREDQRLFQQLNPACAGRVRVVQPGLPLSQRETPVPRDTNTLIITGALNYHPNVASVHYFVKQVLPLVIRQRPDVRLQLVGANPDPGIRALHSPQIEVTGFVPSLTAYLRRATIALAPTQYAAGIQNKVIEAFFTETPLVATSVALRGLDARHNEHALVADTPAAFAEAILSLLANPTARDRIAAAGRRYAEQHHDLAQTTANLVSIYQSMTQ